MPGIGTDKPRKDALSQAGKIIQMKHIGMGKTGFEAMARELVTEVSGVQIAHSIPAGCEQITLIFRIKFTSNDIDDIFKPGIRTKNPLIRIQAVLPDARQSNMNCVLNCRKHAYHDF
jgi:hypothetical protein